VFRDKDLQTRAKQFGALAVLDKPIDIDDLRNTVNGFLHHLAEDRDSLSQVLHTLCYCKSMELHRHLGRGGQLSRVPCFATSHDC